jgi:transglutaminase-like putative cysteine protease
MKKKFLKYFFTFFIFLFTFSCSYVKVPAKANELASLFKNNPCYSNPRFVKGLLVTKIKRVSSTRDFGDTLPAVLIWSSNIKNSYNQKIVKEVSYSFPPNDVFVEKENGNEIAFWNLTKELKENDSLEIVRSFSAVTFDYQVKPSGKDVLKYWDSIPDSLLNFYTKPEPFLEQTKVMKDTVAEIVKGLNNPLNKAKNIFKWVRKNMHYVYPPKKRGAEEAFASRSGDCGQYSALFISMCRIAGIPARQKSGFHFTPENTGSHVWSEIYLPPYGWLPVDATHKDGFGKVHNDVISASTGMNLYLKHAPDWANYSNSEVENCRTDFMQMCTSAIRGLDVKILTKRLVEKSLPLD